MGRVRASAGTNRDAAKQAMNSTIINSNKVKPLAPELAPLDSSFFAFAAGFANGFLRIIRLLLDYLFEFVTVPIRSA